MEPMQTYVYKSARKQQCFVYLLKADEFDIIPDPIRSGLGELSFVIEFDLTLRTRLGQDDIGVVRQNLTECGYHIQFPPPQTKQAEDAQ